MRSVQEISNYVILWEKYLTPGNGTLVSFKEDNTLVQHQSLFSKLSVKSSFMIAISSLVTFSFTVYFNATLGICDVLADIPG